MVHVLIFLCVSFVCSPPIPGNFLPRKPLLLGPETVACRGRQAVEAGDMGKETCICFQSGS